MPYLLDSDWFIDALDQVPEALALIDELASDGIAISVITYMEVYQGTERTPTPGQAKAELEEFLRDVPILPVTSPVARRCALLRERLRLQGKPVRQRALDLLIAATALEHDFTLVTRNREDFDDVPDLPLYGHS